MHSVGLQVLNSAVLSMHQKMTCRTEPSDILKVKNTKKKQFFVLFLFIKTEQQQARIKMSMAKPCTNGFTLKPSPKKCLLQQTVNR